jgi:hypothetical protein
LYVDSFKELYGGNEDSIKNRIVVWNTNIRHKFYNHVGRLQYLNALLPTLFKLPKDKQYLIDVSIGIQKLLNLLVEHKNKNMLCQYDYNYESSNACNQKDLAQSLIGNFKTLFFEQKWGTYFFILGQRMVEVNGTPRNYNWIIDYLLEMPAVGGKSRRRKQRRGRTQRRSKLKTRKYSKTHA